MDWLTKEKERWKGGWTYCDWCGKRSPMPKHGKYAFCSSKCAHDFWKADEEAHEECEKWRRENGPVPVDEEFAQWLEENFKLT